MSDIVERLRNQSILDVWHPMMLEAAAEILRLRAENEKLQWELGKALDTLVVHDAVCAENEKLRAALDCFLEQSTPTQWRYSRERAEKLAKGILAAAALKETGDE